MIGGGRLIAGTLGGTAIAQRHPADTTRMTLADLTDPTAVRAAMDECDRLGRDTFLQRYGFQARRRYVVDRDGVLYDAKALVGVAHGIQHHPGLGPLPAASFSGGQAAANAALRRLGFPVIDLAQWTVTDECRRSSKP